MQADSTAAPAHAPLPKSTTVTRLHITPFNPALYNAIVPKPLQALIDGAGGPSYRTVQTFPERGFGFIDLPTADAQRLKQKLNGTTLKGMKVRVEAARAETRPAKGEKKGKRKAVEDDAQADDQVDGTTDKRDKKKAKVSKGDGVFHGVELPEGRVVKRGWAEKSTSKDEKKKHRKPASAEEREREKKKPKKAKEVDTGQMIFRTKLPANVASKAEEGAEVKKLSKKNKEGRKIPTEVKEFDKTSKFPTFLRDNQVEKGKSKGVREFIEGKGWVDGEGNVVEEVKMTSRPKKPVATPKKQAKQKAPSPPAASEQDASSESEESSIVSSDSDSESTSASLSDPAPDDAFTASTPQPPATPSTRTAPPIQSPQAIHPLEALFKRPASRDKKPESLAPIKTAFSFFGEAADDDNDVDDDTASISLLRPPQTPFTQRDLESRGMRSAAPTPDTAAIGKRFRMPSVDIVRSEDDDDEEDDEEDENAGDDDSGDDADEAAEDTLRGPSGTRVGSETSGPDGPATDGADAGKEEQTEFEKHFWAHRGEYNRAWKQRKREARKEKRQGENRRGVGLRGKN